MGATLGIHWIATTFGTWLHGDPRSSWRHGQLIGPDPFLEDVIRRRMTADAVVLAPVERMMVAAVFGQAVRDQGWRVYAATIQPTHTHLVFAPLRDPVEQVIAMLKYRSARAVLALRRNTGRPIGRALWGEGRFAVFIFDGAHLHNAIDYVENHNRCAARPAEPYSWITPAAPPAPKGPAI